MRLACFDRICGVSAPMLACPSTQDLFVVALAKHIAMARLKNFDAIDHFWCFNKSLIDGWSRFLTKVGAHLKMGCDGALVDVLYKLSLTTVA